MSPSRTDTTALTNALKQVYYIHKNAIAELCAKLEVVSDECEKLKQQEKTESPTDADRSTNCESCIHLQNMNRTLQENLNALLIEKDATIRKLEAKLQAATAKGSYHDTRTRDRRSSESQADPSVPEHDALADKSSKSLPSKPNVKGPREPLSLGECRKMGMGSDPPETVAERHEISADNQEEEISKGQSKLRLTRQGKRRSRYVEEESDTKRLKMTSDILNESLPNIREKSPTQNTAAHNSIFVPETSATLQDLDAHKNLDEDDQESQGMLVIPETMGLDYDTCMENEDRDDDNDSDNPQCVSDNDVPENDKAKTTENVGNRSETVLKNTRNSFNGLKGINTTEDENRDGGNDNSEKDNFEDRNEELCTQVVSKEILDLTGSGDEEEENTLTDSIANGERNSFENYNLNTGDSGQQCDPGKVEKNEIVSLDQSRSENWEENGDESSSVKHDGQLVPEISTPSQNDSEDGDRSNHDHDGMKRHQFKPSSSESIIDSNVRPFLKVPKSNPGDIKTPNLIRGKTPATPSTVSPGIFDDLKTPKKRTRSLFARKMSARELGNKADNKMFDSPIRLRESSRNSPSRNMRQTTLSQVFNCQENQTTGSRSLRNKTEKDIDGDKDQEEKQMAEAIRRSLTDIKNQPKTIPQTSFQDTNPSKEERQFRIPLSPSRLKSPKSKSKGRKSPNKHWNNENASPMKKEEESSHNSPLRRSPRLCQLENSSPHAQSKPQSLSSHRHSVDLARKELFQPPENLPDSFSNDSHDFLNKDDPINQLSLYSPTPPELRVWNLSEESQRSTRRGQMKYTRTSSKTSDGQDKVTSKNTPRLQTLDPNGSLNPDIHLSEYLDLESSMSQNPERHKHQMPNQTMSNMDETIPPNMITQHTHNLTLDPASSQAMGLELSPKEKSWQATVIKDIDLPNKETQGGEASILNFGTPSPDLEAESTNITVSETRNKGRLSSLKINPRNKSSLRETTSTTSRLGSKTGYGNKGSRKSSHGNKNSSLKLSKTTDENGDEKDEWWDDGDNGNKGKENDVFSDHSGDNETIAPSPQASQPQCSIPSSSRSYRFVGKNPKLGCRTKVEATSKVPTVDVKILGDDDHDVDLEQSLDLNGDDINDGEDLESPNKAGTEDKKYSSPPQSIVDSFDRVPREEEEEFPHIQVVRKKSERNKLDGFSCKQCYEYYKNSGMSEEEMQQKLKDCSRHRERYRPPDTPEHFWSLGFPDTAEIMERRQAKDKCDSPINVEKAPRRRRRLEKKF